MALDRQILQIPKLPRWATDSGRILEPDEASKDAGWQQGARPPARHMNWLQHRGYAWHRAALAGALSQWQRLGSALAGIVPDFVVHHPNPGSGGPGYLCGDQGTFRTSLGRQWVACTAIGAVDVGGADIDTSNILLGASDGNIYYTNTVFPGGGSWSNKAAGLSAGAVFGLATKYPSGDALICTGNNGSVRLKPDGIAGAGAFSSPTTPPTTSDPIRIVMWVTGSTWRCYDQSGLVFESTDDGDTWNQIGTAAVGGLTVRAGTMCPHTGAMVMGNGAGAAPASGPIYYSHDDGATWAAATMEPQQITGNGPNSGDFAAIKSVGAGAFVAVHDAADSGSAQAQNYYSVDGGRTWRLWWVPEDIGYAYTFLAMASDGAEILAVGVDNSGTDMVTYRSGALSALGVPDLGVGP